MCQTVSDWSDKFDLKQTAELSVQLYTGTVQVYSTPAYDQQTAAELPLENVLKLPSIVVRSPEPNHCQCIQDYLTAYTIQALIHWRDWEHIR